MQKQPSCVKHCTYIILHSKVHPTEGTIIKPNILLGGFYVFFFLFWQFLHSFDNSYIWCDRKDRGTKMHKTSPFRLKLMILWFHNTSATSFPCMIADHWCKMTFLKQAKLHDLGKKIPMSSLDLCSCFFKKMKNIILSAL